MSHVITYDIWISSFIVFVRTVSIINVLFTYKYSTFSFWHMSYFYDISYVITYDISKSKLWANVSNMAFLCNALNSMK